MVRDSNPTRRDVLRATGGALATLGATGVASADHSHPHVYTQSASNVSSWQATLNGYLGDLGSASSVDVYFEYRKKYDASPTTTTPSETMTDTGSFAETVDPLDSNTFYEYRACAVGFEGVVECDHWETFGTDDGISPEGGTTDAGQS